MSELDNSYAQPEGPNFDIVALVLVILVAILFLVVSIQKAFAEPDPCAIQTHIVTKDQAVICSSPTMCKKVADETHGEIIADKDGTTFTVLYKEYWVVSNGEGCWEDK